jgi:hypothetical protein
VIPAPARNQLDLRGNPSLKVACHENTLIYMKRSFSSSFGKISRDCWRAQSSFGRLLLFRESRQDSNKTQGCEGRARGKHQKKTQQVLPLLSSHLPNPVGVVAFRASFPG